LRSPLLPAVLAALLLAACGQASSGGGGETVQETPEAPAAPAPALATAPGADLPAALAVPFPDRPSDRGTPAPVQMTPGPPPAPVSTIGGEPGARVEALERLTTQAIAGKRDVDAVARLLARHLEHPARVVRHWSLVLLQRLAEAGKGAQMGAALPAVVHELERPDSLLKLQAAHALALWGPTGRPGIAALDAALTDRYASREAARALHALGEDALARLAARAKGLDVVKASETVRLLGASAAGLDGIGGPAGLERLWALEKDHDPAVAAMAHEALRRIDLASKESD
jgi:hypothetical protein